MGREGVWETTALITPWAAARGRGPDSQAAAGAAPRGRTDAKPQALIWHQKPASVPRPDRLSGLPAKSCPSAAGALLGNRRLGL